jgi:hypothetical protein
MKILYQQMIVKEKEVTKRENALKVFLEGRKLMKMKYSEKHIQIECSNLFFN